MNHWLLIINNQHFDMRGAFGASSTITVPEIDGAVTGDKVYCYLTNPDNAVLFECVIEVTGLNSMDGSSINYVRHPWFYDGAQVYMRLQMTERYPQDKYPQAVLIRNGINLQKSGKLTPIAAKLFADENTAVKATLHPIKPKLDKKKKIIIGVIAAVLVLGGGFFFGYHVYDPPTCEEPSVCKICGKEIAPALGHDWDDGEVLAEATCEEDGVRLLTCKTDPSHIMKETIPATGHDWAEATYSKPMTCKTCGATSGDRKGMKYDVEIYFQEDKLDWSYGSNDYYLYPLRFKEPIANCREVSFDYKVSSDSRLWGTWRVYYRCDGKWVHKDDVKIKESGAEVTVVTKFDSKPKVSGVFLIPLNTPNSEYKWDESFRVNYVQSGE